MDKQNLKAVMVGTGSWAKEHARAIRDVAGMELVGVVGHSNPERLANLAAGFQIKSSLSLEDMVKETKPDILDIACNPHYRLQGVRIACDYGIPVVNTEKPMALSPAEAEEISRLCRENNLKFTVNHQKKFMPGWRDAQKIISDGALGKVDFMRATCQGNLLEQGTHLIDMALFFNRYCRPLWVVGQVGELEGFKKEGASAPDMALAELETENGIRCFFDFGTLGRALPGVTNKWHQFGVEVYGDKGCLSIGLTTGLTAKFFDGKTPLFIETDWERDYHQGLVTHFEELVSYARGEKEHISNLNNSRLSFEVIMGIYQSALNLERVIFPYAFPPDLLEKFPFPIT